MRNSCALRVVALIVLSSLCDVAFGRILWAERDGKPLFLHPRRFGQQNPAILNQLSAACPGQVCGVLAGGAVTPLLAQQPECSQQDFADSIINAAKQFDPATQANMIDLAKKYRQAEKNTPPDFTTNPPTNRGSVFCQRAPANVELNGLVQAQDPANNPNIFFDPATGKSVTKGSQANTEPFKGPFNNKATVTPSNKTGSSVSLASNNTCAGSQNSKTSNPAKNGSTQQNAAPSNNLNGSDFGTCSTPQIIFQAGLDGRKETAFQPLDKGSFNHGSAQNIQVIAQFTCNQLTNSCKANQQAKDLCAQAQTAANATTPAKTGIQADVFNKFFGKTTQFAKVQPISDTGVPVDLSNGGNPSPSTNNKATPSTTNPASTSAPPPSTGNLQKFTGSLGGVAPPPVTAVGNGQFQVQGNAVFKTLQNALTRSCDVQHNQCANAANASGNKGDLTVAACGTQQTQCDAATA